MTQQCPTCGKELDGSMRYCPDDGTPLVETAATTPQRTPTSPSATQKVQTLELPVLVGGRYRLTELRGGGGMAKVYKALDVTLEREVAVKLINPELRADPEFDVRFQREARIASQLHDPHIVVVHDFGLDAKFGPFLVMEFLQGQSLRERLATGPLPLKAALQLSAQLVLALIHAHDKGIVHRDIKPDNIFLLNVSGVRLHVRVLDFGIARIYRGDDPANQATLTHPGAVLGTPRYMSPEQLAGQPVDARSDLYSTAVVIHEALTGQIPYVGGKKLTELCPDASPALQELLDQCLKPSPKDRPASAIEVYLRLQELGKASGILLLPPGAMDKLVATRQAQEPTIAYVPKPKAKRQSRRAWILGVVGVLVLVAVGWGVISLLGWFGSKEKGLLGIELGVSRDVAVVKMAEPPEELEGDPWKEAASSPLRDIVRPEDVSTDAQTRAKLRLLRWANGAVAVLLQDNKVQAVGVGEPYRASCPRGVRLGDDLSRLSRLYPEPRDVKGRTINGVQAEVYRYDTLGIGFEARGGRVTAIALYPKRS